MDDERDERIVISSSAALSPDAVSGKGFTTAMRGYQPAEVRQFLKRVADEVGAAAAREAELRRALHEAENRAAHPELDEAALTSSLGEHAGRLIASARETAAAITAEAERTAAATLRDAEYRIARIRQEADTLMARRVDEADGVSASLRQSAEADARAVRDQAQAEAEAAIQAARSHGKEMVAEARAVRERMLGDLARRRRVAEVQLEQLRVARERLVQAYDVVRRTLEEVTAELAAAEPEARLAAEAVGRRMSDADAHPPLRLAEPPMRMASSGGGAPPPPPPPAPRRPDPSNRLTEPPTRPSLSAFGSEPIPPAHAPAPFPPSSYQPTQPAPPPMSAPAAPVSEGSRPPGGGAERFPAEERSAGDRPGGDHSRPERTDSDRPPVPAAWIERAGSGSATGPFSPSSAPGTPGPVLVPAAGIGAGHPPPEPVFDPADPGTWAGAGFGKPRDKSAGSRPSGSTPPSGGGGSSSDAPATKDSPPPPGSQPASPSGSPGSQSSREAGPGSSPDPGSDPSSPSPGGGPSAYGGGSSPYGSGMPGTPPPPPPAPPAPYRPPLRPQTVADSVPFRSRVTPSSPPVTSGAGRPSSAPAAHESHGSVRTVTDLRPLPPDLPLAVPPAAPEQPPELATAEQPAVRDRTPSSAPVDDLFARLRHQVPEAEPATPAPSPASTPLPPSDDMVEEAALARRDQHLDPLEADLTRALKRILQDEQNEVLERLREGGRAGASSMTSALDRQASAFTAAAAPALAAAYRAGGADIDDTTGFALGGKLANDLAAPLRERLERVVATASDDMEELAEAVRAAYRHTKLQEIEQLVRHHTAAAHALGAFAATAPGTRQRWVVDDEGPCPDCHDNTLAGPTPKGEPYPTGQEHPPAHLGCRCLLVAVPEGSTPT